MQRSSESIATARMDPVAPNGRSAVPRYRAGSTSCARP